jgi:hypothetical protein
LTLGGIIAKIQPILLTLPNWGKHMKKIIFLLAVFLMMNSLCFAETIYLKNGRVIEGKILEKTDDQIEIDSNGIALTYYADEIERIEGGVSDAAKPQASLEVPSLQAVSEMPSREPFLAAPSLIGKPMSPAARDIGRDELSKKDLILKYMEVTGAKANMEKTFNDIINAAAPDKKASLRQVLNIDDIIDQLIPVYEKYFTSQDLQELIAFYESPAAKKLFRVEPLLLKDVMETSRRYLEGKIE